MHPALLRFYTVRELVSGSIPAWIRSSLRSDQVYGVLTWRAMWNARHVLRSKRHIARHNHGAYPGGLDGVQYRQPLRMKASPAWLQAARHITPNGVYFANRTMPAFVVPEPVEA